MIKTAYCTELNILHPSTLLDFKYEIGPYYGCEHNCLFCYARNHAKSDWREEILIHDNFRQRLERELSALEPQTIFIGMDTDPYQPSEEHLLHTRQSLELLSERNISACLLTRSDLVVRDIDLISAMPGSSVGFSFAFVDEDIRRLFETNSPSNSRRFEALRKIKGAGIETYALITPIMPFLTEVDQLIERLHPLADTIWFYALEMKSENDINWQDTHQVIRQNYPEMEGRFREIAFSKEHDYWQKLKAHLENLKTERNLNLRIEF